MKLTENFDLSEFGDVGTFERKRTAYCLARFILQPLRDEFGPLVITSGYRDARHNARVGGASRSEHLYNGCEGAVDVSIPDHNARLRAFQFIQEKMPYAFGQLIWYTGTTHLHISLAGDRHQGEMLVRKIDGTYQRIEDAGEIAALDRRLSGIA